MISRQNKLLDFIEIHGEVDLAAIQNHFDVSSATVRRDILRLEKTGKVIRKVGGICALNSSSLIDRTFYEKQKKNTEEKRRIAKAAMQFVEPGMTVALDSGSSIWQIASELKRFRPLTILTNMLGVIEWLGAVDGIDIVLTGGLLRKQHLDFVGAQVVSAFSKLHADVAFIGADSYVPGKGAFGFDEDSSLAASAIGRCADKRILAIDHSKFKVRGYRRILANHELNYLVTDSGVDEQTRQLFEQEPFRVILA